MVTNGVKKADAPVGAGIPDNAASPQSPPEFDEFGVSTNFPTTSWDTFAFGQERRNGSAGGYLLQRDSSGVPLEKLIEMRRKDAQTRALLRLLTLPIMSCVREGEWVTPPDVEGADKEVAYANQVFTLPPTLGGMTTPLRLVLKQTLLALVDGFSVFEPCWQVPKSGPLKGKITLRKLAHRDSRTLTFRVDDNGGFDGLQQIVRAPDNTIKTIDIPKEKALFFTVQAEENPFYGVSMFEAAWYNFDVKTKLYYASQMAAQHAAVPQRIGKYPAHAGSAKRNAFGQAVGNLGFNSHMTMPSGEDWDVQTLQSNSGFDFIRLIEHQSHLQAKSVLLHFMDSENRLAVIENGGQDASADMFVQALTSIMDEIAEMWSIHLMPKLIDWNFNSGKYPFYRFGQLGDTARDAVKDVFGQIVTSGMLNCTPEFMREAEEKLALRLGFDIDYAEIRKREEEAAAKRAELEEAEAAAGGQPPGEGEEGPPSEDEEAQPPEGEEEEDESSAAPTPSRREQRDGTQMQDDGTFALSGVDQAYVDEIVRAAQELNMIGRSGGDE